MDQHPVPQNISSYEFRLVGDMTLKQFFQLAGGIGIGVLFWKLPLPIFLKLPLAGLSILTGIMLAFVPVSGRPFSQWLMAFVKAIYSPTEYVWAATPAQPMDQVAPVATTQPSTPLDKLESQVVSRIAQLFTNPTPLTAAPLPVTPMNVATAPIAEPVQATQTTIHSMPTPAASPLLSEMQPKRPIMVSEIVDAPPPPAAPIPIPVVTPAPAVPVLPIIPAAPAIPVATVAAVFTDQMAAPPRSNMIAGVVVNPNNQPIEGVILEISDSKNGIPVRALRSNKLGQFQTATQLSNGEYHLAAEKDGLTFDTITISCQDKIINPILVTAHA